MTSNLGDNAPINSNTERWNWNWLIDEPPLQSRSQSSCTNNGHRCKHTNHCKYVKHVGIQQEARSISFACAEAEFPANSNRSQTPLFASSPAAPNSERSMLKAGIKTSWKQAAREVGYGSGPPCPWGKLTMLSRTSITAGASADVSSGTNVLVIGRNRAKYSCFNIRIRGAVRTTWSGLRSNTTAHIYKPPEDRNETKRYHVRMSASDE